MKKISQELIEAENKALKASLALHGNCSIKIDERLALDAIESHDAFITLAESVDTRLETKDIIENKLYEQHKLMVELDETWRRYTFECINTRKFDDRGNQRIQELRKQLFGGEA
jgi:hypothetical protein